MQRIDKKEIIDQFNLNYFGAKGWMSNKSIKCNKCGRDGKFGVLFTNKGGLVHCFYCDYKTSLFKWLREIGLSELIKGGYENSTKGFIEGFDIDKKDKGKNEFKDVDLPLGFKRLTSDEYLDSRGFEPWQYEQYQVGCTESILEKKLMGYLIFQLFQKGKLVSWLARSKLDYEWHKENLRKFKEGSEELVLRYMNSEGTDFDSILGGFDEINKDTHTIILVEGLMDKANVDRLMGLNTVNEVKCCFTFGNKVSEGQLKLIKEHKGIKTIILMFDPDAIKQMQSTSGILYKNKFEVLIADLEPFGVDPGDLTKNILNKVLKGLKNYLYFYVSKI